MTQYTATELREIEVNLVGSGRIAEDRLAGIFEHV